MEKILEDVDMNEVSHGTIYEPWCGEEGSKTSIELHPTDGAACVISIATEGTAVHKFTGVSIGENINWTIGEGDNCNSEKIDQILCGLAFGESSEIDLCDSEANRDEEIPDKDTITVMLHEFKNRPSTYLLSAKEKLRIASDHKGRGVSLFKGGNIEYAFKRFSKALKYLILMLPERDIAPEIKPNFRQLRWQCYSNMAACQLKFNSYSFVIENCTKALDIDPNNVKCLYRRAQAYMYSGDFTKAHADLIRGLGIDPLSTSLNELKRKIAGK